LVPGRRHPANFCLQDQQTPGGLGGRKRIERRPSLTNGPS
jgi:hypothetical protein